MADKKDNVIAPKAFSPKKIGSDKINELREQGLVLDSSEHKFEDLKLPSVSGTEQTLGELTDYEKELFVSFYHAQAELEDLSREFGADFLTKMSDAIRNRTEDQLANEEIDEDVAYDIFRLSRKVDYLKGLFYWYIGERFQAHDFTLGIRDKGKVIRGQRKW